ncbi:hypothetical protein RHGRI_024774 [Rhododendron griersonianum]|uniref:Uncharacterized protein n=1 Tax=Rhododendron griersonianum TaxID=479676 RepID=A0AAV6J8G4_9ERIC|nr:hypothetical protein RHGRI_024774 [Rhododendron griersonianum]
MEQRRPRPPSPLRLEFAFLPPSDKSTISAELPPSPLRREFAFLDGRIEKLACTPPFLETEYEIFEANEEVSMTGLIATKRGIFELVPDDQSDRKGGGDDGLWNAQDDGLRPIDGGGDRLTQRW